MDSIGAAAPGETSGDAHRQLARAGQLARRPFGTHLRVPRWASLVLLAAVPVLLLTTQVGLYLLVGVVEGTGDVFAPTLTPAKLLAVNVSTGLTAVIAVVLLARLARTPWRAVFSSPRRWDRRRLWLYTAASAPLVALAFFTSAALAPGASGWTGFGVSGTTIAMLVVIALTTPIQAAGEEIAFRGVLIPAASSWFTRVEPALVVGLVLPGLVFAALHVTSDPWLWGYYVVLSVCTGLMGVVSRGLEAAIGFHIANNLVTSTVNALLADGGVSTVDRSTGAGGPELLVLAVMNVTVLGVVWWRESRRRRLAQRVGG